jgi:transposase
MVPMRRKEYSDGLREVVIKHFLDDDSEREIAHKVLIPCITVHRMIVKYKSTKCIGKFPDRGRKRKSTVHVARIISHKIKTDRWKAALSIKMELETELGTVVSVSMVRRPAHEVGLNGCVAR